MAWYRITENVLDAIANAINAKTGGTSPMTPVEMVSEIQSIQTGGGGSSWTHQQYTHAEDWLSNNTGNTSNFYQTYLTETNGKIVVAVISNNTATGAGKATLAIGLSNKYISFFRTSVTNVITNTYDFFISAGSVIDVYVSDNPHGGA